MSASSDPSAGAEDGGNTKKIAIAVIVIGGLGAVASAMRPILRQKFGGNAMTKAQRKAAETAAVASQQASVAALASGAESPQVAPLLERLRELQRWHQQRHPLWYGRPTPELVSDMGAMLMRRAEQEEQDLGKMQVQDASMAAAAQEAEQKQPLR